MAEHVHGSGAAYPVNLVQVLGLQDDTADNTLARGGLHGDLDLSVEDVEVGLDGRGFPALADGERSAVGGVVLDGRGNIAPAGVLCGSEITVKGLDVQASIDRARELRGIRRVAVGVGLREGGRNDGCQTSSSKGGGTHGGRCFGNRRFQTRERASQRPGAGEKD